MALTWGFACVLRYLGIGVWTGFWREGVGGVYMMVVVSGVPLWG